MKDTYRFAKGILLWAFLFPPYNAASYQMQNAKRQKVESRNGINSRFYFPLSIYHTIQNTKYPYGTHRLRQRMATVDDRLQRRVGIGL